MSTRFFTVSYRDTNPGPYFWQHFDTLPEAKRKKLETLQTNKNEGFHIHVMIDSHDQVPLGQFVHPLGGGPLSALLDHQQLFGCCEVT